MKRRKHSRGIKIEQRSFRVLLAVVSLSLILQPLFPLRFALSQEAEPAPVSTPAPEPQPTPMDVSIDTGSANVGSETTNIENTNTTSASGCSESEGCSSGSNTNVTVNNDNNADTSNTTSGTGSTGANATADTTGDSSITTGDVDAQSDTSNIVNTNITGSGTVTAYDIHGNATGDVDLADSQTSLTGEGVANNSESVNNHNTTTLENLIELSGDSGNNNSTNIGGSSSIETGDVDATVNLSNVVNTNIVGADWLFTLINIFGNWAGSLILPNPENTDTSHPLNFENIDVTNSNTADLSNDVTIDANSGNNSAEGNDGNATIHTGNVNAQVKVSNTVNTNIFGNFWDWIKINVFGDWNGYVFGLPDSAFYIQTDTGLFIYNDREGKLFDSLIQSGIQFEVDNSNTAGVKNKIILKANSGNNSILDSNGNASIITGDVDAKVSIANILNTNLIGNGWNFAMVNVFGTWNGNLEFGRPDLWITEEVTTETGQSVRFREKVTYTFTYGNKGDGTAHNVVLFDNPDINSVEFSDLNGGTGFEQSGVIWSLGNLKPGETGKISYVVEVNNGIPVGSHHIYNQAAIDCAQSDRNPNDNFTSGFFIAYKRDDPTIANSSNNDGGQDGINNSGAHGTQPAFLVLAKSNSAQGPVKPGDIVRYSIILNNTGDTIASDVIIQDILKDSDGVVLSQNAWPLGDVYPHEEIAIGYDVLIMPKAYSTVYTNSATVDGTDTAMGTLLHAAASTQLTVEVGESILGTIFNTPLAPTNTPLNVPLGAARIQVTPTQRHQGQPISIGDRNIFPDGGIVLGASNESELLPLTTTWTLQDTMYAILGAIGIGALFILAWFKRKKKIEAERLEGVVINETPVYLGVFEKLRAVIQLQFKKFSRLLQKLQKSSVTVLRIFFKFIILIKIVWPK